MQPYSEETLLEATKDLIRIPSTADNHAGLKSVYDYIVRMIRDSNKGITIEEFDSGSKPSLLAYIGGQRPDSFRIILNGHLDVVPGKLEQYEPYVQDGKLYGRGVYDMKAAAVILTAAFCEFVDKVPYPLALQIVTDEESAGKHGTLHQVEQGVRGEFVICGDCGRSTTAYEIANQTKGLAIAEVQFQGSAAHGAYPWRGDNAIIQAMEFGHAIHKRYPTPQTETFETTVTITAITTSNDAHTKVPDNATVKLDARFTNNDPNFRSKERFASLISEIDPNAKVITMHDFCAPAYCEPQNRLLLDLKAAAEKTEGHDFDLVMRHGTGDGRFYTNVGNEACEFGIAGEHQHGDDEHITLDAFRNYLATMRDFLEKTIVTERDNRATEAFKG